ncbi:MAG: pyridoxal phosphate-dependent class II aminotransferase [Synergistaceae bacterium]|nr:pyridoxal phosphate-dependent class II aminotransferase [Synergistaceae bacterium]
MTEFRLHGANPEKTYRSFSIPVPDKIYDFSTNTNVLPWNGKFEIDIQKTLSEYPDDESLELCHLIAEQNHCSLENVLVTNGSNEAIYLISSYQTAKRNCILQPAYGEYMRALKAFDASVVNAMSLSDIKTTDETVWICNPCNPTGAFLEDKVLIPLLKKFDNNIFIIDEAYRDFMYDNNSNLKVKDFSNLIIMRSLTKSYHLCGSRIGYVMSSPELIKNLKRRQPTWSVNSIAQQAAVKFMQDKEFLKKTREYYRTEVPRLIKELKNLGFEINPTSVNYFLLKTSDDEKLIRFLLTRGIVVRHTRNFLGLDGKYVRIAARSIDENDILINAMKEYESN